MIEVDLLIRIKQTP